ncbi:hypothetical protein C1H76_3219 [Elsinoe australis]|uniref:Uncharacterized protein n=1 Tax=Elsinoe australis TaxID=40998 RepID=A0A4U7B5R0_9PEZI|nr:hypothetical protein C1H76_3219 [Elsinoe australis]
MALKRPIEMLDDYEQQETTITRGSDDEEEIGEQDMLELLNIEQVDTPSNTTQVQVGLLHLGPDQLIEPLVAQCPPAYRSALMEFLEFRPDDASMGTTMSTPLRNDASFKQFMSDECSISGQQKSHIVAPSGSWSAALMIKLHYPTFTCANPEDNEVADASSPCPRMLMNAGFSPSNTLWVEAYWRRQIPPAKRGDPTHEWTEELRACHEAFTRHCEERADARVELVLGSGNRKTTLKNVGLVTYAVVFGEARSVQVSLQVASDPASARVERLLVYGYHPEYLFRNPNLEVSKTYDYAVALAARVARIDINYGYFERRAHRLAALGIKGRVSGDNALHDAIQLLMAEKISPPGSLRFESLSPAIINWLRKNLDVVTQAHLERLLPEGSTIVQFVHSAMVRAGGQAKAALEKLQGRSMPSGLDKIAAANRAKDSAVSRKQEKSAEGRPVAVRVKCGKCGGSEFDDTNSA